MPEKPRDPLDEPDDLLAEDDSTESEDLPEPAPSEIDAPPEPPTFVWEDAGEEPVPSDIEVVPDEEPGEPLVEEPEPDGDDLYWADAEESESEPEWHAPEEPSEVLDWPAEEEEDEIEEEDWAALEEPRRLLPAGLLLVGLREQVSLPGLELTGVIATMDTGRRDSLLCGEAGDPVTTTLLIAGLTLTVRLRRVEGPVGVRLGRDVIAGRFVVDAARELSASEQ